jgi:hypothetical protein
MTQRHSQDGIDLRKRATEMGIDPSKVEALGCNTQSDEFVQSQLKYLREAKNSGENIVGITHNRNDMPLPLSVARYVYWIFHEGLSRVAYHSAGVNSTRRWAVYALHEYVDDPRKFTGNPENAEECEAFRREICTHRDSTLVAYLGSVEEHVLNDLFTLSLSLPDAARIKKKRQDLCEVLCLSHPLEEDVSLCVFPAEMPFELPSNPVPLDSTANLEGDAGEWGHILQAWKEIELLMESSVPPPMVFGELSDEQKRNGVEPGANEKKLQELLREWVKAAKTCSNPPLWLQCILRGELVEYTPALPLKDTNGSTHLRSAEQMKMLNTRGFALENPTYMIPIYQRKVTPSDYSVDLGYRPLHSDTESHLREWGMEWLFPLPQEEKTIALFLPQHSHPPQTYKHWHVFFQPVSAFIPLYPFFCSD